MPRKYRELEYSSKQTNASSSDIINLARKHFALQVEIATAKTGDSSRALKDCHEKVLAQCIAMAKQLKISTTGFKSRVRDLLRTEIPKRGSSKEILAIEVIAKAVGVWNVSPEDIVDPHVVWERVFNTAEDIAVFSHADPAFWNEDRLQSQVNARCRMLFSPRKMRIRRLLVLPIFDASKEYSELEPLINICTGIPPKKYVSKQFENHIQLLKDFPIATRCIRANDLSDYWRAFNDKEQTYEPPLSALLWKPSGENTQNAVIWSLNEKRVPIVANKVDDGKEFANLSEFFDYVFDLADPKNNRFSPIIKMPARIRSEKEKKWAEQNSVP